MLKVNSVSEVIDLLMANESIEIEFNQNVVKLDKLFLYVNNDKKGFFYSSPKHDKHSVDYLNRCLIVPNFVEVVWEYQGWSEEYDAERTTRFVGRENKVHKFEEEGEVIYLMIHDGKYSSGETEEEALESMIEGEYVYELESRIEI